MQFRLFCKHPASGEMVEKKLEIHKDKTFREVTEESYKVEGPLHHYDVIGLYNMSIRDVVVTS